MNILLSELSTLYGKNIIFESLYGSIYISGFIQSINMNGIKNGYLKIQSLLSYIKFNKNITIFTNNINGVYIYGKNGIYISKNATNLNGTLTFNFLNNNMIIESPNV